MYLHRGAGVVFVDHAPWPHPSPRANVPCDAPASPTSLTNLLDPCPTPLGFFPKGSGVEREQPAPVSQFKVELSQS